MVKQSTHNRWSESSILSRPTKYNAPMVELVDTLVLEASAARRPSSSLGWGTKLT